MSQLSALLGVLQTHQGDELILETGQSPTFLKRGEALRLFLRAIPDDRHTMMLREVLTDEVRADLATTGRVKLEHHEPEHGRYEVHLSGPGGERMRFVHLPDDDDEPTAPVAVAPPANRPPPASAAPTVPAASAGPVASAGTAAPSALPDEPGEPTDTLANLLAYAAERRASDLHLATGGSPTLRLDGRLVPTGATVDDVAALLDGVVTPADHARLRQGTSIDRAVQLADGSRFRMNVYRHADGLAAAFRVLRPAPPPLGKLLLPVDLSWVTELPHGLVLFCGATGSGKSTTLASLLMERLRRRGGVLITLEDPIEYTLPAVDGALVRQREVGRHVESFARGLRDALREDPDVVLVGEMRDPASIQLALTAAETGHLVLASLHSRDAPSAVERIVDAYPPERQRQVRVQLADALRGVVAQQLLPRAGRKGRRPAVEVLRVNQAAAALIRDGKTPQLHSVMQTGRREGMMPMDRCVQELRAKGLVP